MGPHLAHPSSAVSRTFDLGQLHTDEVLLEIDSENGRLDTEAMFSGKPWPA